MFSKVDLPLPEGPDKATSSAAATASETSRSAGTVVEPSRYNFDTPVIRATVDLITLLAHADVMHGA